jgi:hypothetical protein
MRFTHLFLALAALGLRHQSRSHERRPEGSGHAPHHADEPSRGRSAETPGDIPRRGWRDVAWRVKAELTTDNLSMIGHHRTPTSQNRRRRHVLCPPGARIGDAVTTG